MYYRLLHIKYIGGNRIFLGESEGGAGFIGATGTANPVDIIFVSLGNIKVNNMGDIGNI